MNVSVPSIQKLLLWAIAVVMVIVMGFGFGASRHAGAAEVYYDTFRFGQRALGMGGAVIGDPRQPEATFYNPGGMGFMERSVFSGAMTYLGFDSHHIENAYEVGGQTVDVQSKTNALAPRASVILFKLGKHQLAWSTFVSDRMDERFGIKTDFTTDSGDIRLVARSRWDDTTTWMGPSWGFRINEKVAIGASIFLARRKQSHSADVSLTLTTVDEDSEDYTSVFADVTESASGTDYGLIFRAGVVFKPAKGWSFGLTVTPPSLHLGGDARIAYLATYSGDPLGLIGADPLAWRKERSLDDLESRTLRPWNFGFGAQYGVERKWMLAFSATLYTPISYARFVGPGSDLIIPTPLIPMDVHRELTVNWAVGTELWPHEHWPIRLGFFSNNDSSAAVPGKPDAQDFRKVDLLGASASFGWTGWTVAMNVGAEVQWGSGSDVGATRKVDRDFSPIANDFNKVERDRLKLLIFLSGAVKFGSEGAALVVDKVLSDDPKPLGRRAESPQRAPRAELEAAPVTAPSNP